MIIKEREWLLWIYELSYHMPSRLKKILQTIEIASDNMEEWDDKVGIAFFLAIKKPGEGVITKHIINNISPEELSYISLINSRNAERMILDSVNKLC